MKICSIVIYLPILENQDSPMANNEADDIPKEAVTSTNGEDRKDGGKSPTPPVTPPPGEEETQEIIVVNENTDILDLNHGRIGKIENLEPLQNLER